MSRYQVNDEAEVVLLDSKTRRVIRNCTRILGDTLNQSTDNVDVQTVNVRECDTRFGEGGQTLAYDVMPEGREMQKVAAAFVQYASVIVHALETGKDAVVYCKNGRSRSPSVVAAFFILYRGVPLAELKQWFQEAYPAQRPETARVSSTFPNLERFEQVLHLLVKCLVEPTKSVRGFNLAGKLFISIVPLLVHVCKSELNLQK